MRTNLITGFILFISLIMSIYVFYQILKFVGVIKDTHIKVNSNYIIFIILVLILIIISLLFYKNNC